MWTRLKELRVGLNKSRRRSRPNSNGRRIDSLAYVFATTSFSAAFVFSVREERRVFWRARILQSRALEDRT